MFKHIEGTYYTVTALTMGIHSDYALLTIALDKLSNYAMLREIVDIRPEYGTDRIVLHVTLQQEI